MNWGNCAADVAAVAVDVDAAAGAGVCSIVVARRRSDVLLVMICGHFYL